jgi:phosphatidylinositol kinase/protein kinase (PI-3  family)
MRVLRHGDNSETLMNVLEAFVHDPLVEWTRSGRQQQQQRGAQAPKKAVPNQNSRSHKAANDRLRIIQQRLSGVYNYNVRSSSSSSTFSSSAKRKDEGGENDRTVNSLPLSVEGQVHRLIHEATSESNLMRMYVGWMPHL